MNLRERLVSKKLQFSSISLKNTWVCLIAFLFIVLSCSENPEPQDNQDIVIPGKSTIVDGIIQVDGKPYFPIGYFDVVFGEPIEFIYGHLTKISEGGFNTFYYPYDTYNPSYLNLILDKAASLNLKIIVGIHGLSESKMVKVVNEFKNKPALLAWSVGDDLSLPESKSPTQIRSLNTAVKEADPNHITWSHVTYDSNPDDMLPYLGIVDVLGYEDYPVNFYPMRYSYEDIALLRRTNPNQVIVSDSQIFNWMLQPGDREHTRNELRVLTYLEIAGGARGVLYYTYYDGAEYTGAWNLPELWDESKNLMNELKTLGAAIYSSPTVFNTNDRDVKVVLWEYNGAAYLVAVNTCYAATYREALPVGFCSNTTKTIDIAIPGYSTTTPLFESTGLAFSGGRISGSLPSSTVLIYKLIK